MTIFQTLRNSRNIKLPVNRGRFSEYNKFFSAYENNSLNIKIFLGI